MASSNNEQSWTSPWIQIAPDLRRYISYMRRSGLWIVICLRRRNYQVWWSFEMSYESIATVGEIRVWWRADFQSGSRVLKKVFWTFSYLYLWHTMWFHAKKLLRTLKFWKSLNSLCKSGSRPQKSPKKAQKTDHSIAIYSNFWIGMVYFGYHLVKAHVQTVQNMYGKGG